MFAYLEHSAVTSRGLPDPSSVDQIAYRLRITRAALGHTQAVMSQLAGSSTEGQAWGNYESGERRISLDHALALCAKLGMTLEWIYRGNIHSLPADLAEKIQIQMRIEGLPERSRSTR